MPYICEDCREECLSEGYFAQNVGELTFKLTGEIASYLDNRLDEEGTLCYSDLSEVLGAIEGMKADFIERVLKPYELRKRIENGDVWGGGVLAEVHTLRPAPETVELCRI